MPARKRLLPDFLRAHIDDSSYARWLARKAASHLKRDRGRGYTGISGELYRDAIHAAVVRSEGRDAYTGEPLAWELLSQYNNVDSEAGRHEYKAGFALLPTVDHVHVGSPTSGFCICAWRTNDAKNDLPHEEFLALCARVLRHAGYSVHKDA